MDEGGKELPYLTPLFGLRIDEQLTGALCQETLNFWKQIPHVMKYFREEENPTARLPQSFMQGFLEVTQRLLL